MRFQYLLFLSAFILTSVHTTTLSDFPQCAQECIQSRAGQIGGSATDLNFICKSSAFLNAVHECEAETCSQSDISHLFPLAIQLCESVGGTNAIGIANLSSCAQPGLSIATAESGCPTTNWTCICTSSAYTIIAAAYEEQDCSPADRKGILDYTSSACAAVGIQLQPPAPNAPYGHPSSAVSSLAPTSSVQSVYELPQCAQPCLDAALLQSGCQPSDWACICVAPAFIGDPIIFCESQACTVDDRYGILNISSAQCSAVGVALVPPTTNSQSLVASATTSSPLEAATVSSVLVPQFSDLPGCAQFCATNATTKTGGSISDLKFLCKNSSVLVSIGACAAALCSPTDQQTSFGISQKICGSLGGVASINPTVNPSAQQSVISAAYPTTTVVASLDDVPPCGKPCLVIAFRDSGCLLEDVQCQCSSNAFMNIFTDCQAAVCGVLDLQRLLSFTVKRCGSIGLPIPSSRLSIESDVAYQIPTATDSLPTPTDVTNAPIDVVDLPACAQECIYSAASFAGCDIHNLTCICGSESFAAYVNTCQTVACTADELQVITSYSTGICLPVPGHLTANPSGALLSSYLAEPTYSAPSPPTITNTPNDIAALPSCAQSCIFSSAAKANCSSVNDLTCVCQNPTFLSAVASCEEANCNNADLEYTLAFSQELCKPVGGIATASTFNLTIGSSTGTPSPVVTPFTGEAAIVRLGILRYLGGVMMWIIWIL